MDQDMESIFKESGCLSPRELTDYLEGKLSDEAMHRVEVHLADCAFCADALEGLQQVEDKAQIPVIIRQIHGQLRKELASHRSDRKKAKRYVWLSSIILIILIILLIAYFSIDFALKNERSRGPANQPPPPVTAPAAPPGS